MELIKNFRIKNIVISEDYKNTHPKLEKLVRVQKHYLQTKELPVNIVINDSNVLIDGYITYLLAVQYGIEQIDVYRGYAEIVEAVHYAGSSKAYMWRVPMRLNGMITTGDYVIVPSPKGAKRVKVIRVMRQQYPTQNPPLKLVYKKC